MDMLIVLVGLGPTAANVLVSGRITTADGRLISNAKVLITSPSGEVRTALSSAFGYYNFEELEAGRTYILSVSAKRFTFSDPVRILWLNSELTGENFIANE